MMDVRRRAATTLLLGIIGVLLPVTATVAPAEAAPAAVGPCRSGYVALTFDDGPARPTGRLIRVLRRARVPATFFMVGQRVAAAPQVARRVERAGFLVANHSWAHTDMRTQTSAQVAATLRATQQALVRAGTHPMRLMRPPYGALDAAARTGIRRAGFVPVLWTVDSRDWTGGTARQVADRILAGLRPGRTNVVLQHDGVARSATSVSAVPLVVRSARRRGYCFTGLDEAGRPGFPTPRASVFVTDAREGREAVATVRLDRPAGRATSVLLRTRSRSATVGRDVPRLATRVTVPAGRMSVRTPIPVLRDRLDEFGEQVEVAISRPQGVVIGRRTALARLVDIDPEPAIDGTALQVTEPGSGQLSAQVRFRLSGPSAKPVRVVVATQPGTADEADFVPLRRTLDLQPGRRLLVVELVVLADDVEEVEEQLTVAVVGRRHVRAGTPAVVTIEPPAG